MQHITSQHTAQPARIVVAYGSTTGACRGYAQRIGALLPGSTLVSATQLTPATIAGATLLVLCTSTWGQGEMQQHWHAALPLLTPAAMAGKTVALMGCGDSLGWPATFCGGLLQLHQAVAATGATIVGAVPGWPGLAIDTTEGDQRIQQRIAQWAASLPATL